MSRPQEPPFGPASGRQCANAPTCGVRCPGCARSRIRGRTPAQQRVRGRRGRRQSPALAIAHGIERRIEALRCPNSSKLSVCCFRRLFNSDQNCRLDRWCYRSPHNVEVPITTVSFRNIGSRDGVSARAALHPRAAPRRPRGAHPAPTRLRLPDGPRSPSYQRERLSSLNLE